MSILVVIDCSLKFGCIQAKDIFTNSDCVILLYENPRLYYSNIVPSVNDVFICAFAYHSVYIPLCRISMCHWLLRRTIIPNDILTIYFDPFEQVNIYRNFAWYSDKIHQRKILDNQ